MEKITSDLLLFNNEKELIDFLNNFYKKKDNEKYKFEISKGGIKMKKTTPDLLLFNNEKELIDFLNNFYKKKDNEKYKFEISKGIFCYGLKLLEE